MSIVDLRAGFLWAAMLTLVGASRVSAQACHGTPSSGGISYDRGAAFAGSSNGATATVAGRHAAFAVGARVQDALPRTTAQAGEARFSLQFGIARVSVCPGIGLDYRHRVWDPPPIEGAILKITSHGVAALPGLYVGMEQPVYAGVTLTPFVGARYSYRLYYLDTKASVGAMTASGDTVSSAEIEYGLTVRYSLMYLGWSAVRDTERPGNRPATSRLVLGITWGTGKRQEVAGR